MLENPVIPKLREDLDTPQRRRSKGEMKVNMKLIQPLLIKNLTFLLGIYNYQPINQLNLVRAENFRMRYP